MDGRKNNGKSPEEMVKVSKNGTVSVKHDGHGFLSRGFALPTENCEDYPKCGCELRCKTVDVLCQELETEIMSLDHIESSDLFLVRHFVKFLIFEEIVDRWLLQKGLVIDKGKEIKLQPIFGQYFIIENATQRLADRLGLSPMGRKQLKDKAGEKFNFGVAMAQVQGTEKNDSPT